MSLKRTTTMEMMKGKLQLTPISFLCFLSLQSHNCCCCGISIATSSSSRCTQSSQRLSTPWSLQLQAERRVCCYHYQMHHNPLQCHLEPQLPELHRCSRPTLLSMPEEGIQQIPLLRTRNVHRMMMMMMIQDFLFSD